MSTVCDITCDSYLGHILSNDILSSERLIFQKPECGTCDRQHNISQSTGTLILSNDRNVVPNGCGMK